MGIVTLDDGKYKIHHTNDKIEIYRNGELWRNETGDGLFLAMVQKLEIQNELLTTISNSNCRVSEFYDEIIITINM